MYVIYVYIIKFKLMQNGGVNMFGIRFERRFLEFQPLFWKLCVCQSFWARAVEFLGPKQQRKTGVLTQGIFVCDKY